MAMAISTRLQPSAAVRSNDEDQGLAQYGDGTFAAPIEFTTGQGPAGIVIADFTGDGKPDVITANYGGSSISLLRHNGLNGSRPVSSRPSVLTPQITRKKSLRRTSTATESWMWLSAKQWTSSRWPPLRL